mgnify:CR=1 FL=1
MACAGLGARLFQVRREAGLGLIRLGKLAGVSHSTIGDIEKGRQLPAVDTVERLARALKVRASWLAFGVGEPDWTNQHDGPPKHEQKKPDGKMR